MKKVLPLITLLLTSSCVGEITNNINAKIDSKIDSNPKVDNKTNTEVKTGDINNSQNNNSLPKDNNKIEKKAIKFLNYQSIYIGQKGKFDIEIIYEDGTRDKDITYISNNKDILTITSDGNWEAISEGKATILITSNKDKNIKDTIFFDVLGNIKNNYELFPSSSNYSKIEEISKETVSGKVFDRKGLPINDVTVTLTLLDEGIKFPNGSKSKSTKTVMGNYKFEEIPVGTRIEIKAGEENWSTQKRFEIVKLNKSDEVSINTFNFGAEGIYNAIYYLQNEPQIELVKVNGITLERFGEKNEALTTYSNANAAIINSIFKKKYNFKL